MKHILPPAALLSAIGFLSAGWLDPATATALSAVDLDDTRPASAHLGGEELQSIVNAARQRWIDSGLTEEQVGALEQVTYQIADLGDDRLAWADGFTVTIDQDAAGSDAWFVDATPLLDEEFLHVEDGVLFADPSADAAGKVDLLSVVLHEMGHILGLSHSDDRKASLMGDRLGHSTRHLPAHAAAAGLAPSGAWPADALRLHTQVKVNDIGTSASIGQANTDRNVAIGPDGSIYVVFYDAAQGTRVAKSTDGGQSFSPSVSIPGAVPITNAVEIDVAPNGNVFVAWSQSGSARISRSTDGGATFSVPSVVGGTNLPVHLEATADAVYVLPRNGSPVFVNTNGGVGPFTATGVFSAVYADVIADPSNGDVYVGSDNATIRVFRSTNNGSSFTNLNVNAGSQQHSSWAGSFGPSGKFLFVAGGGSGPTTARRIDLSTGIGTPLTFGSNTTTQGRSLAADGFGNVIDMFQSGSFVQYRVSQNFGATFGPTVTVAGASTGNVALDPTTGNFVVVYQAGGNIYTDVFSGETTSPPLDIAVADVTDGSPGVALTDGQAPALFFGCTQPGVPVSRTFEIRNDGGTDDLVLPAAGLSLPAGYTMNPPWPTALITPEFKVVAVKTSASASTVDSLSFELLTMPSQLSVESVSIRIPDAWIPPNPSPQTPYIDEGQPIVVQTASSGVVVSSTSFGGQTWTSGQATRWQQATLSFQQGTFTGSLEDPSQNDDVTFGFGLTNLNPPALPSGTQNDGDGFGQAGIEAVVVLYNSLTNTTETIVGVFQDDGIDNDTSEATFTATPIEIPVPVFIPPGETWESVVGTPLTIQLLSSTEGYYPGTWSLENNDPDEDPFNFPIDGLVDGTPPLIDNLPLDIEITAASETCSAVVHWVEPSVSDNLDPSPTLGQTDGPVSGSTFPVGTTVIEYTASDCAGNMTVETFEVRVLDTLPPLLVGCLPARIVATLPPGETTVAVTYPPLTAIDNCDPNPSVVCTPPSGSVFGVGTHTVTCYAEDSSGNQSPPASFVVVVVAAQVSPTPRVAEVVVERNEAVPGVAGGTFNVVNHAFLNEAGGVMIEATMIGAGPGAVGLWKNVGSGLELVSRNGDLAPGSGGFTFTRYDDTMLNDTGDVAFEGYLDTGAPASANMGHWAEISGTVQNSVLKGAAAPATSAVFSILHEPAFDGAGATLSPANLLIDNVLVTIGNDTGIWRKPAAGPLAPVAREGDPVGAALPGANYGQVASRVVANASGEVAFFAFLEVGPGGVTLADNAAVFAGSPGSLGVVAREDETAPGPDPALFSTFSAESINTSGEVAFEATLKTGGGGSAVVAANNTGIYTNSNGSLEMVAREGDPVLACGPPGALFSSFRDIFIADNGDVFFHAFLTGPGVSSSNDGGFWRWRASTSRLEPVLVEGESAPSTQGAVFSSLLEFAVSDGGAQVVTATLTPGVGDCTLGNNFGLWMDDGSIGVPILRVREADGVDLSLPSETPALTVLFIDRTTNVFGGSGGHGKVLNDLGEVIVRTSFDQNTSGAIILSDGVPD